MEKTGTYNVLYCGTDKQFIRAAAEAGEHHFELHLVNNLKEAEIHISRGNADMLIVEQSNDPEEDLRLLAKLSSEDKILVKILILHENDTAVLEQVFNSGLIDRIAYRELGTEAFKAILKRGMSICYSTLHSKKRIDELQVTVGRLNFLHEVSQKISEKKPLNQLLDDILLMSKTVMNAEASSFLLYNEETNKLHFHLPKRVKHQRVLNTEVVELGSGIAGWVAEHKKPLVISDCYNDPRFNPEYDKKTDFHTHSMICVPLLRKNQLIGVLQVINKLDGGIFRESELPILETLASQCAIAIENNRLVEAQIEAEALERELATARVIQQKLLPEKLPELPGLDISAKLIPATQVGGDYYDIIKVSDRYSLLLIADVSGKGIPAALIVSVINAGINTYLALTKENFSLIDLASTMNRLLIAATTSDKFATCWFGLIDHNENKLESLNAGHNAPMLFLKQHDHPKLLDAGGLFLGMLEVPYETEIINFKKDMVLVFFTDGVTEAWDENEEEYGEDRLQKTVGSSFHKTSAAILTAIEKDVRKHVGEAQQSDDFTCVVCKVI